MNCSGFQTRHLEYLDGTLDETTLVACERHRAECAECARFDTRVRRSLLVCHNVAVGGPPCDLTQRVLGAVQADRRRRQARVELGRRVVRWAGACAACAAAVLLARVPSGPANGPVTGVQGASVVAAPTVPALPVAAATDEPMMTPATVASFTPAAAPRPRRPRPVPVAQGPVDAMPVILGDTFPDVRFAPRRASGRPEAFGAFVPVSVGALIPPP